MLFSVDITERPTFLKGNGRIVDLRNRERAERTGRKEGRRGYGWNVLHERRIKKQISFPPKNKKFSSLLSQYSLHILKSDLKHD